MHLLIHTIAHFQSAYFDFLSRVYVYILNCKFSKNNKFLEKKVPGGRVVSDANWQAWGPEFDSAQSQNFFRKIQ